MSTIYKCEEHGRYKTLTCPICNSDNPVVNHRTLLKIILNPIFRLFGFHVVSIFENNQFVKYLFVKTDFGKNEANM